MGKTSPFLPMEMYLTTTLPVAMGKMALMAHQGIMPLAATILEDQTTLCKERLEAMAVEEAMVGMEVMVVMP